MSQAVIDQLEARLRELDQQQLWLDGVIAELDGITTPPARARIHRAEPVGPIAPDLFVVESDFEASDDDQSVVDSDDDGSRVDLNTSVFTTFYHSDRWGVYPRGSDRGLEWWEDGYESDDEGSDAETVVCEWEDPHMTPMKRLAPVAAAIYHNDSPFDDYLD